MKPSTSSDVQSLTDPKEYQPGQYIACTYDNEWYIGIIMVHYEEQNDFYLRFRTRANNSNALSVFVSALEMQGRGGCQYRLANEDVKNIKGKLPAFK